jgi:hypothetical protein
MPICVVRGCGECGRLYIGRKWVRWGDKLVLDEVEPIGVLNPYAEYDADGDGRTRNDAGLLAGTNPYDVPTTIARV